MTAKGIMLPTTVENGRLKMRSGDDYIRQLVETAMGPGDSENPFQDIALGEFMIFDINDPSTEGSIREKVREVFGSLERDQLAKLQAIRFQKSGGTLTMYLSYEDLETGSRVDLDVPLGS
jgi:hypothetical protein